MDRKIPETRLPRPQSPAPKRQTLLETQIRLYDGQRRKHFRKKRDTVEYAIAEQRSANWLQQFSPKFMSQFPREIRDMIYEYIWPPIKGRRYVHHHYSVPCSVPTYLTEREIRSNDDLPYFLRLATHTDMARELAGIFCARTLFRMYGVERLDIFLNTSFLANGCIPRGHIRRLELVLRPPYWDLPVFPLSISENYHDIAMESTQYLEQLLQIENPCGFRLKIAVVVRRMFDFNPSIKGNVKFCRWLEVTLPLLARFYDAGFILEIEQVENSWLAFYTPSNILTPDTIFNWPREEWLFRIYDNSAFTLNTAGSSVNGTFEQEFDKVYRTRRVPPGIRPCVVAHIGCYHLGDRNRQTCRWCRQHLEQHPTFEYPNNMGILEE